MTARMIKLLSAFALAACLGLVAPPALAIDLDQAKAQGYVGEQQNGYLGVVRDGPGVAQLVDEINLKRRQLYRDIAGKNNTSLQAVEAITGQKLISRAKPGEFVQGPGGWVRR